MAKSKSKTFPKGTDSFDIGDWVEKQIRLVPVNHSTSQSGEVTDSKYLITITKLPEKDETPQQAPLHP